MTRFTVEAADSLIDFNRWRLAQLADSGEKTNPLTSRVVRQPKLSLKCLKRQRDEIIANRGDST